MTASVLTVALNLNSQYGPNYNFLTLKASFEIVADNITFFFLSQRKLGLTFHENHY